MNEFWQTLTAWGLVGLTVIGFAWRFATRARRRCGGHCDCPMAGANTHHHAKPGPLRARPGAAGHQGAARPVFGIDKPPPRR